MRLKISLFIVLMVTVSSQSSFAALNAYLRIVGGTQGEIKGDVTQAGREDSILIIAYDQIISSNRDPDTCMPSRLNHQSLQITKHVDKATPLLYEAFNENELITEFFLRFWQPTPTGAEEQFFTIELRNARIVGIHQEMLNNIYSENLQHKVREHISFVYETITRTYEDGGLESEMDWSSDCGTQFRISDVNFDGITNILDVAIVSKEWLLEAY